MQLEAVGASPRMASNWCGSADANCPEKPTTITQTAKAPTNPRATVSLFIGDIHDERHGRVNGEAGAHSRSASEFRGWRLWFLGQFDEIAVQQGCTLPAPTM